MAIEAVVGSLDEALARALELNSGVSDDIGSFVDTHGEMRTSSLRQKVSKVRRHETKKGGFVLGRKQ